MRWSAMLQQYNEKEYCLVRTDFQGNNLFNFISDDAQGIEQIDGIVQNTLMSGHDITIAIDHLAVPFEERSNTVWLHLIRKYASHLYKEERIQGTKLMMYMPKDGIGIQPLLSEHCSILLLENNSSVAFFSYLHNADPPFHPIDIARLGCSIVDNLGLAICFRSLTIPPSSQDIENFLKHGHMLDMVVGVDVHWLMMRKETSGQYDKTEFHLQYMEIVSKFKKYGGLIPYKIAVIETCRKYGIDLYLGCPSLRAKSDLKALANEVERTGRSMYRVVPLQLHLPS